MNKHIFLLLLILTSFLNLPTRVAALQEDIQEQSDPYISLEVEEVSVKPGDQLVFTIIYGNHGPKTAQKVTITLNQPIDGRSPLTLVNSSVEPSRWVSSEYGNLAQFVLEELETDKQQDEKNIIEITVKIRDSAPSQTLTPTVNLQAPKRPPGKRLLTSEPLYINITSQQKAKAENQVMGETTQSAVPVVTKQKKINSPTPSPFVYEGVSASKRDSGSVFFSEELLTTAAFLFFSGFLLVAFLAGRKSKKTS